MKGLLCSYRLRQPQASSSLARFAGSLPAISPFPARRRRQLVHSLAEARSRASFEFCLTGLRLASATQDL
eukprot:CAMPEP_0183443956 /NCGR_PEP_ID=MMETSP0370-20130417/93511_1 /TAXON_ID=268820 /ORGANISM="Peridinium aciculiferum, Strain PAER-2" /LENGTH=69 /DNA_ID=CAMNT_0025634143 /DNA_START=1 /DNA_END=207 /DNA_ORIENTATION=+